MAMIDNAVGEKRTRAGVRRARKVLPRVDMTPMVDLGFLLITFFIFSTEISKPVVTPLVMPSPLEGTQRPMTSGETGSLTVLLGPDDEVWYYAGSFPQASAKNAIYKTDFSPEGIRRIIQEKQTELDRLNYQQKGRDALVLMIKPGKNSAYKNVVDILDEVTITRVKIYALMEMETAERGWLGEN